MKSWLKQLSTTLGHAAVAAGLILANYQGLAEPWPLIGQLLIAVGGVLWGVNTTTRKAQP